MSPHQKHSPARYFRKALSIASELSGKTPDKNDPIWVKALKYAGMVDTVQKCLIPSAKPNVIHDYLAFLDVEVKTSQQFVSLFFSSDLQQSFTFDHLQLNDETEVLRAKHPSFGTLHFIVYQKFTGKTQPEHDFWYSRNFDFKRAIELFWSQFQGRVHIELVPLNSYGYDIAYSTIPDATDPLLGGAQERLDQFIQQHHTYNKDKVPRTYLFYGKQGCGKTSFALRIARYAGGKVLRIDANSLIKWDLKDFDYSINLLQPDFILVDDVDRSKLEDSLPTIFTVLSDFKGKYPNITIVMTINDIKKLDPAMLRPGRIDEIVEFFDPTPDERRGVLEGYLDKFGVTGTDDLAPLVEATEGLTAAYLREVALQLRYRSVEDVLGLVKKMLSIVGEVDK